MTEPFTTLSSENSSVLYDDSTPLTTPDSATHDTSRSSFHMKDLEDFAKDLQSAAHRAFPNEGRTQNRYQDVFVYLLSWSDDELQVYWELERLEKVFKDYGFITEQWPIPRINPHLKLMSKAVDIVNQHEGQDNLVIIYYAGHAHINSARQATWCCKSDASYASLEWSAIQTLFEKAHFDVLLLFDCCAAAASASPTIGSGVTETIAACGFESIAPPPGPFSFSSSLTEVLQDWMCGPPFSVAMLHNKVLSILKHERPQWPPGPKRRRVEYRRTPIHFVASTDPRLPSIELGRRRVLVPQEVTSKETNISESSNASSHHLKPTKIDITTDEQRPSLKRKGYEPDDLSEQVVEDFDVTRVVISLALEEHQNLNTESCQKWLASCPALVKIAKVEAVWKSFSTLMLLSIPVFVWDMLPENPACSFVGYVTSPNLIDKRHRIPQESVVVTSQKDAMNSIYPPYGDMESKAEQYNAPRFVYSSSASTYPDSGHRSLVSRAASRASSKASPKAFSKVSPKASSKASLRGPPKTIRERKQRLTTDLKKQDASDVNREKSSGSEKAKRTSYSSYTTEA